MKLQLFGKGLYLSPVLIEPFNIRTVLPPTDVLLVALALTNETENLIGANELKLLSESAVIVNVARGKHIVTEDLVEALRNNEIAVDPLTSPTLNRFQLTTLVESAELFDYTAYGKHTRNGHKALVTCN